MIALSPVAKSSNGLLPLPSKWGVQVKHHGTTSLYTTSDKAAEDMRGLDILIRQWEKRLRLLKMQREKVEAAYREMLEREYNGKARVRRTRPTEED